MTNEDLLKRFEELCRSAGGLRAQALMYATAHRTKLSKQKWAAFGETDGRLTLVRTELCKALGIQLPAEQRNRNAFIFHAMTRRKRLCEKCGSNGANQRRLHWWAGKDALVWEILHSEACTTEKIKKAIEHSSLLCTACAQKAGCKLKPNGQPDIS